MSETRQIAANCTRRIFFLFKVLEINLSKLSNKAVGKPVCISGTKIVNIAHGDLRWKGEPLPADVKTMSSYFGVEITKSFVE